MTHETRTTAVRVVRLLAVGPLQGSLLRSLAARLSQNVPVPCALSDTDLPAGPAWLPGRDQRDADDLLGIVEAMPRAPAEHLVCVTSHDIGNRIFSFFFGRARIDGHVALVSIARLDPTFYGLPPDVSKLLGRALKEILHELGHNAGLHHCAAHHCLMHFSADVGAVDLRGQEYCEDCGPRARALFAPAHGASIATDTTGRP